MGLNELYHSIVDEVVDNVKEAFLEEGFDEQTLKTLKEAWLRRISESQQHRPQVIQPNPQHGSQQQQPSQQPSQPPPQSPPQSQPQLIQQNNHQQQQNNHQQQQQPQQIQQASVIQQNHNHLQSLNQNIPQLDGSNGTSDEDDDIDESDDFVSSDESDDEDKETDTPREDEDPLNSGDDVSNDESSEMFETENVVVCQYDKITRNRNKWKFHLKDGIMNINGRDYVFQKAVGDAEW